MLSDTELKRLARAQLDWAITARRELHRVPEPGFQEEKTRSVIRARLKEIGCEFEEKNGWITGFIRGALPGPVTALRADFDALPIREPEGCEFRSEREGWMHACGHDMHTAILLSVARLCAGARDQLPGGLKLLFQPAEETVGGAKPMAEGGCMDEPRVERVYGLHVMPRLMTGQVECRPGALNAGTDSINICVRGKSAHGAYPELGRDAIVCAASLITAMQTLVSRSLSPLESAVLSFGKIEGGAAGNIICDKVNLSGTLRTASEGARKLMIQRMRDVASGVGAAMGCECVLTVDEGYKALINDAFHCERALSAARRLLGEGAALVKDAPSMGGEDFGYFLDRAPGAFFHIGCSKDETHPCAPLHSELFSPDENCMEIGILLEAALVMSE